ncbi:hypothetical protein [Rhizobium sp. BK251]|uniref:hypothetical protein n=1 Tax=Rhizobium sp. BK251 TaxID=2512125 RepID=UPI00104B0E81|nr:hypothetical protein [Rhizobium sp. BK251]TCL75788.1 hypothetical protein EV286_101332 [Rhizobium sp. BK251]
MLKFTLAAAFLASAFAVHVYAQEKMLKCDEPTVMQMSADADAMTDASKKAEAMKEMNLAKEAFKTQMVDECMMHMENARKTMGKS